MVPLGSVLRCPDDRLGKRFRAVIGVIEGLHEVPLLESIPVLVTRNRGATGFYHEQPGTGRPLAIEISRKNNDGMELTLAHEIGHLLERALIPGSSFGVRPWATDETLRSWQTAVKATAAYGTLQEIVRTNRVATTDATGNCVVREASSRYAAYLVTERELWARSYAQWVAVRGGGDRLMGQARRYCFPPSAYPIQWHEIDFEPVARQIDLLFERLGWLA